MHYLKVLCDEIYGRDNYVNTISVKMKDAAGASGGGEDKRLKKIQNIFCRLQTKGCLTVIEPKGQHLIDNDIWKEHFLLQLENDSKCIAYPDYDNYSVKGLPFYTHNVKEQRFKEYFEKLYKHN